MHKGPIKSLRIGLSRSGIGLLQTSGWLRQATTPITEAVFAENEVASKDRLAAKISSLVIDNKCGKLPVTVVLSDSLVRFFMVTPPKNTARLQDCRTAVEMRFQSLFGEPASDWELQADWSATEPFLTCAAPRTVLQALRQAADEHALTLVEIVPQFIASWNRWQKMLNDSAWLGVANEGFLTLGAINERRLSIVRTTPVPADAWKDEQWLTSHLSREALRCSLAMPQRIQVCGDIPGHWTKQTLGGIECTRLGDMQNAAGGLPVSGCIALAYSGVLQ